MGLIDFLLFGAFMNSLRNRQDNNSRPIYSGDNYDQGYEDGYTDCYLDHDDYQDHDSYDCCDSCECDDFFDV
jgi:hypothetical protein